MQEQEPELVVSCCDGAKTGVIGEAPPTYLWTKLPMGSLLGQLDNLQASAFHEFDWRPAEGNPEAAKALVQKEDDSGHVRRYPGTVEQAEASSPSS